MGPTFSVVIPTQRRPLGLAVAVRSVHRQVGVALSDLEVVVVDNDAADSARPVVEDLARGLTGLAIHYVHEPTPGVASARNAGLMRARGAFIAFLDDDEEAQTGWLQGLASVARRFEADVVFGPVLGRAPEGARHRTYLEAFFSRRGPAADTLLDRHYGCGNSLVRRSALACPDAPFDTAFNRRGGEDDVLFSEMRREGRRFAWAATAAVFEDPSPGRLTLRYAIMRAFAHGQGATALRAAYGSAPLVAWSLATGAAQALFWGLLAALGFALFVPGRAFLLDRAARGAGKMFFSRPFHIAFYGLTPTEAGAREAALAA